MTSLEAIILGLIQGATEFLPVSSSGHLVIGQTLLGVESPGVVFEVALHVATLVSILFVYRARVGELAVGAVRRDPASLRYVGLLVVATLPAVVVGLFFKDAVEALFESPVASGVALLVTGLILWTSRRALAGAKGTVPGWTAALLIGVAQAFAILPGISRSGSTVVAALWLGVAPREAAAFSFLMAVPAISGAAVLQLGELGAGAGLGWEVLALGSLFAAVTGVLAIRTFVAMLARESFHLFAPYCWIVGALFLAYLGLR
ncbi:MAG TPA: undecaprenyl-diphosphate phosphatase [Longimicrobiales bacterium]|nr:undecaprenyl-diphosphate phosphatase [Longimicrobiales bacterium]